MSPLNYSPRGAPVNLGVYDFLVKMDFLGVFDTSPAEALLHFLHRLFDILDVCLEHLLESFCLFLEHLLEYSRPSFLNFDLHFQIF